MKNIMEKGDWRYQRRVAHMKGHFGREYRMVMVNNAGEMGVFMLVILRMGKERGLGNITMEWIEAEQREYGDQGFYMEMANT